MLCTLNMQYQAVFMQVYAAVEHHYGVALNERAHSIPVSGPRELYS